MGDRNNPIKFGPEWLRNMPRERSAARSTNNGQNTNSSPVTSPSSGNAAANSTGSPTATNTNNTVTSKVLLAKLRYGREEMLALYDRNAEAPPELKVIDTLYQPRGKQPVALNNTFEDDMRDSLRGAPPGVMSSGDRFGIGRGLGRGVINDGRGRPRGSYIRSPPTGRGGYSPKIGGPRMPYSGGPDDDNGSTRPWTNNTLNNSNRNSGDMYRSKRQGTNTNWRQPQTRDEGEEWRSSEPGRSRQLEKWDRDWSDRPSGEKSQSWSTNRRPWVGGDTQNNEEIPEWVGENAECGGTFDSSGAFHGYSNDDTNLPKHQESSYPLTRSHTHGSFPRPKAVEEGSEEWWASEKAKKLSPKRFDASDIKFKKQPGIGTDVGGNASTTNNKPNASKEEKNPETPEKREHTATSAEPPEANAGPQGEEKFSNQNLYKSKFGESKTFDALMRSDINVEEASDERGNFQSVIITPNNSLRQKHQHIVMAPDGQQHIRMNLKGNNKSDIEHASIKTPEDLLVGNIFGMTIDDEEILPTSLSNSRIPGDLNSPSGSLSQNQNQNLQMSMSNSALPNLMTMDMHANKQNIQGSNMQPGHPMSGIQPGGMSSSMQKVSGILMPSGGLQNSGMSPATLQTSGMPNSGMPSVGMQNTGLSQGGMQNPGLASAGMQNPGLTSGGMQNPGLASGGMQNPGLTSGGMQNPGLTSGGMQNPGLTSGGMQNPGLTSGGMQNPGLTSGGMQAPRVQTPGMQPVGITNSALNASLGLPIGPGSNMGLPLQGVPQQVMPNVCMASNISGSGMGVMASPSMQNPGNMPSFQSGMSGGNVGNNSLFLGQNSNNPSMSSSNDMPMSNHTGQNNMFPMHGLQHSGSQASFSNSIYSNNAGNLADQWYYEDPERNIQGPFSSKDMYNWYRAGFFSPRLMVRRACETIMRPLGSYGHVVPFMQMDMMPAYPMSGGFESRPQGGAHENILNPQPSLGLDVMNIGNMNMSDNIPMDSLQFGSVGLMANQSFGQPQQMVDSLWGQPSTSADLMWMQQSRQENRVNNLAIFFWDQQPSAITSNSLLPEDIAKEMKTEDQILAQLRASQGIGQPGLQFMGDTQAPTSTSAAKTEDCYPPLQNATPNMEELHKLIQKDTLTGSSNVNEPDTDTQIKSEKGSKLDQSSSDSGINKQSQIKSSVEQKLTKPAKDTDKSAKNKENNNTKNKTKKNKDEKKDEIVEIKSKEEEVIKAEKRSQEPSPSKSKKEEKSNKKELEREKKEWIKEGFTIVKGSDKNASKDNKKKAEEARAAEEAERKRKEEEKLVAEEDKKKKLAESTKKIQEQQQQQQQQQRQATESVIKKAPWSAVATQAMQATNREGLTLAEIQRLEREKKLEQMKEQQQMMQIIAQQQAAALAREQEMQAGLGWAKKKGTNTTTTGQSLAEIQAEARKQAAAAAAAAAAQAIEEAQVAAAVAPPSTNHVPWGNTHNGGNAGGFWDTQLEQPQKQTKSDTPKPVTEQTKTKKKPTFIALPKKETSPAVEFDNWCTNTLASWSSKIDVPTFVGFLKDIESPYEVKDYVKCYLGDSKDTNDFSRQFLERRSKLLRVGMVTPSDDLCSPAIAVNPRTTSGSDYQEVKGKGKKAKKNKMLKVDARILGFSVTAAEDRINVGDIDTV